MERPFQMIAIGVSAGGMSALSHILPAFPEGFPMAIVIVQHVRCDAGDLMASVLEVHTVLPIKEADEKEPIHSGRMYIAPAGYHLLIEPDRTFSLSVDAKVNYARPSIDVLFESAADVYGDQLIGVILTGANTDGSKGLRRVAEYGGLTVVQDPKSAEVDQMPRAALATAPVDHVMSLKDIGSFLVKLGGRDPR